jgi:hypothetical protein
MTTLRATCTELARAELRRRVAEAELGRRSFADFARFAIAAGIVDGLRRVQWGPHLDALCQALQFQLEGWIVANGPERTSSEWPAWAARHAEMIERQRAGWERTWEVPGPDGAPRLEVPTWEDGEPEPWLRYVLTQNVVWNVPPGTLKSTIAMVLGNAWIWLHVPTFSFGAASGVDSNVDRDAKATRDLVRSKWYRDTFAIGWEMVALEDEGTAGAREAQRLADEELGIKRDTDAVSDWATTVGGKRRSRTVNAGFTGTHVDATFIDDPDDADKVYGEAERVKPQNRFTRAIENRVNCEHRSLRLVLQQRVHPLDFTAYLLSHSRWSPATPKGWAWLCIPARFGRGPADAPTETPWGWRDWRTEADEMIHPRITPGVIADKMGKGLGAAGVAAQYDQHPELSIGGIIARRHPRCIVHDNAGDRVASMRRRPEGCPTREAQPPIVVRMAELARRTLSVDANNTLELKPGAKPSAVGLLVLAMRGAAETFVLEDRTRVLDVSGTNRAIYEAMRAWALDEILVELKAAGPSVVSELRIAIRRGWYLDAETDERIPLLGPDGRPARPEVRLASPTESKAARNQGLVQPWEEGRIFVRDGGGWLHPHVDAGRRTVDAGFIGEVCTWSRAEDRGDRMDALSQYVARHRPAQAPKTSAPPIVLTRAG